MPPVSPKIYGITFKVKPSKINNLQKDPVQKILCSKSQSFPLFIKLIFMWNSVVASSPLPSSSAFVSNNRNLKLFLISFCSKKQLGNIAGLMVACRKKIYILTVVVWKSRYIAQEVTYWQTPGFSKYHCST